MAFIEIGFLLSSEIGSFKFRANKMCLFILSYRKIIAVNQDSLGIQGTLVMIKNNIEVSI